MHKILLVDDVRLLLELQKKFLASSRVEVFTASDGAEALEVARRELPQLIVLDKYMPVMDGITCCRELKTDPDLKHIPIIMVSNATQSVEMAGFHGLYYEAYLSKPLNGRQFLNTIKTYLPSIERRSVRIPCRVDVCFVVAGTAHFGVSEDLSPGGMFVATDRPFSCCDELTVSFMLPGSDNVIEARGRVAWINRGGAAVKPCMKAGVGIEFLEITGSVIPLVRSTELKEFIAAAIGVTPRSQLN
jgi:CheY-like chemotaxis protein/Tfp pilus assembly protein PilZ